MLASLHPNSPTSDQAVKDLIDHRARASHTRYTSVSFSQRSDSPSIYSRGDLSPNPIYHRQGGWPPHPGYSRSLAVHDRSNFDDAEEDTLTSCTRDSFDHDGQYSPAAGDDDDDCVSFISAPTPRPPSHPIAVPLAPRDTESDVESPPTEELEEDPRMSMLGPKMRFVSRAPWELGESDLWEGNEDDANSATDALSLFGNKMTSWRSRDQDKTSTKGLGLSTLRSHSPGARSVSGKKGGNGINTGLHRYQTRESQKEGPYGPYLAGASQSHGAILTTLVSSSQSTHSVTDSLSSDNIAHGLPIDRSGDASPGTRTETYPDIPFPTHPFRPKKGSYSSNEDSTASFRSASPPSSGRYVHPYANPDIIPMTVPTPSTPLPRTPGSSHGRYSEERERRGESLRRASESATSPPRTAASRKVSASALPMPPRPPLPSRPTDLHDYDEEDDEIVQLFANPRRRTSSKPAPPSPVRSMVPQPGSPMHNLITLDQARARAQIAPGQGQNNINGNTSMPKSGPSSTLIAGLGLAPGVVDHGVLRGQVQRSNPPSTPTPDSASGPPGLDQKQYLPPNPRPRTMSSGKHMFGGNSSAADGEVPAKTLKHKKSAFMKLFQGGKDKERERDQLKDLFSPAPEYPVRAMSTPPQLPPSESSVPPLPSLHNIKRVPPPLPLSVVVTSPSFPPSGSSPQPSQEAPPVRPASPPRLRQASAPLLSSSNAQSSNQAKWLASGEPQPSTMLGPEPSRPAASAPPSQTSFEALSLRPVSTIFSAKFPDLLCPSSPPVNSPATASFLGRLDDPSPVTPGFRYSRANSTSTTSDYPITPISGNLCGPPTLGLMPGEDHSGLVVALQEQILNSRKMWQRQIWELEGQVKDLKAEVEDLRNTGECETCGKAKRDRRVRTPAPQSVSVVDRPRPRLGGGGTRSVFGGGSDM